ncbi:MAG: hypothetical protein ACO1Q7_00795 [Gemmatimonas sp.]
MPQPSESVQDKPSAVLSPDRLSGFRTDKGPNQEPHLVGRYLANMAVSQALYPYLHTLEVVLRNRIYAAVSAERPVDPDLPDHYDRFPCWLDATKNILLIDDHRDVVEKAKTEVHKDLRRRWGDARAKKRDLQTPGRLVANLSFAFWVFLFDEEYAATGRGDPGLLWPGHFDAVFPNAPGRFTVTEARRMLRRMLVVRNRVMHYERITPWADSKGALDPQRIHRDLIMLINAMSPRAAAALDAYGPPPMFFEESFARYCTTIAHSV